MKSVSENSIALAFLIYFIFFLHQFKTDHLIIKLE